MQIIESPETFRCNCSWFWSWWRYGLKDIGRERAECSRGGSRSLCLIQPMTMIEPNYDGLGNHLEGELGSVRAFGDFDSAYGGWDIEGEPYTRKNGTEFDWFRSRMLGGRTNHWGRISLRFGPKDFKRKSIDGLGDNWPIGYEDVAPYYDKVDKLIGVFGTKENFPNEPNGFYLPPPKPRLHELYFIKGANKAKIPAIPSRLSILTKRINSERGVCFYCRQCSRACMAHADFSSGTCLIFPPKKQVKVLRYLPMPWCGRYSPIMKEKPPAFLTLTKMIGRSIQFVLRLWYWRHLPVVPPGSF